MKNNKKIKRLKKFIKKGLLTQKEYVRLTEKMQGLKKIKPHRKFKERLKNWIFWYD